MRLWSFYSTIALASLILGGRPLFCAPQWNRTHFECLHGKQTCKTRVWGGNGSEPRARGAGEVTLMEKWFYREIPKHFSISVAGNVALSAPPLLPLRLSYQTGLATLCNTCIQIECGSEARPERNARFPKIIVCKYFMNTKPRFENPFLISQLIN